MTEATYLNYQGGILVATSFSPIDSRYIVPILTIFFPAIKLSLWDSNPIVISPLLEIFVVEQAGSLPNLSVSHLPTTYCLIF